MDKVIVLIMSIVMPPNVPDVTHIQKMDNFESCWDGAKDYMTHELSEEMRSHGAIGLSAACSFLERPSQRN